VHGRTRIGFIRGPETTLAVRERFEGYEEAMAENGIALNPEWMAQTSDLDGGADAIKELFDDRKQDLEAIVAFNDAAAITALDALLDRGIRVPEDVAIVGYHDIPEVDHVIPPLTTVTASRARLARGKPRPRRHRGQNSGELIIDTGLVIRRSCGCFQGGSCTPAVRCRRAN
jgi:DNA-binding LacI/PurR family transcriptional regulator